MKSRLSPFEPNQIQSKSEIRNFILFVYFFFVFRLVSYFRPTRRSTSSECAVNGLMSIRRRILWPTESWVGSTQCAAILGSILYLEPPICRPSNRPRFYHPILLASAASVVANLASASKRAQAVYLIWAADGATT